MKIDGSAVIPPSAVPVRVTNIFDPYTIRVYQRNEFDERIRVIESKMGNSARSLRQRSVMPSMDDCVMVYVDPEGDMFTGVCYRGIVCTVGANGCTVFLIDYGVAMEVPVEQLQVLPKGTIMDQAVSFTVGLYNIVPALRHKDQLLMSEEWPPDATVLLKGVVEGSDAVYFDCLALDKNGQKYGELYVEIAETITSLREVLVSKHRAVLLTKSLLKFIEDQPSDEESCQFVYKPEKESIAYDNPELERINGERMNGSVRGKSSVADGKKSVPQPRAFIWAKQKYEPLASVSEARFPQGIHKSWNSSVNSPRPKRLQAFIWPALRRNKNVCAIGTEGSGKTFGTVAAVCAKLVELEDDLPKGKDPSALIICASSADVERVHSLCTEFLQNYPTINSVAAFTGQPLRSLCARMYNGCQILISTVRFLDRFMERNKNFLVLSSLRCLLIDDVDVILNDNYLGKFLERNVHGKGIKPQMILTATRYTERLERFNVLDYYVCIASFMEAAAFRKIYPEIHLTSSKEDSLKNLLTDEYKERRTLIVCKTAEEVEQLNRFVRREIPNVETMLAHESMDLIALRNVKKCWSANVNGSYSILIASDEVLPDLDITNVGWLIHYSIMMQRKTRFNFTFSTLLDSLEQDQPWARVTTILDKGDKTEFQSSLRLLQLGCRQGTRKHWLIPIEQRNVGALVSVISSSEGRVASRTIAEEINEFLDEEKKDYPVCETFKSLGHCPRRNRCPFSHRLTRDEEPDFPLTRIVRGSEVKLMPVCVHSATHISARIVYYRHRVQEKWVELSNKEHLEIAVRMQQFYSSIENRRTCRDIKVGQVYGLEDVIDNFKRVLVTRTHFEDKGEAIGWNEPKFVDVKYVDSGHVATKINASRLLFIPPELTKLRRNIVEVYLTGIRPGDSEHVWSELATEVTRSWFQENMDENSYPVGTVVLISGDTIWVDTLRICMRVQGHEVLGSSLKHVLLEKGGELNEGHIESLSTFSQGSV